MINSRKLASLVAGLVFSGVTAAADFSFSGAFSRDDDAQLFSFSIGEASNVTLRSWGYAGGVNAAGQTIERGGFDPVLALFDGSGVLIGSNDDGGPENVAADAETNQNWDTFLQTVLAPGNYQVSMMQYDNFANGPTLSEGFFRDGTGNFTTEFGCGAPGFCDISGVIPFDQRNGNWALDILSVDSAAVNGTVNAIPEPATYAMLLMGLGLLGFSARCRKQGATA